jgi:excisionase family DNA binding protein
MEKNLITTKVASERLGISQERVRQLIITGRLPSQQFGRDHLIKESDLALVAERKAGRPKKEAVAAAEATGAKAVASKNAIKKGREK